MVGFLGGGLLKPHFMMKRGLVRMSWLQCQGKFLVFSDAVESTREGTFLGNLNSHFDDVSLVLEVVASKL